MTARNRKCWQCGNGVISELCLTSDPPQYQLRCSACDYMHTQPDPHGTDWEPAASPARTPEQHMADLNAWLQERGLALVPVAVGRKSGQMASVQDWEPDSHYFTFALVPKQ